MAGSWEPQEVVVRARLLIGGVARSLWCSPRYFLQPLAEASLKLPGR